MAYTEQVALFNTSFKYTFIGESLILHPSINPSQRNAHLKFNFNRRHALVLLTLLLAFTAVFTVTGPHTAQAAVSHTAPQSIRPISGVFVGCGPGIPSGTACNCPTGYVSQGSFDSAQCVAISAQTYQADDKRLNGIDAGQSVAVYCNTDGSLSLTPILPGGSGDTKNVQTTKPLGSITKTTTYGANITVTPGPDGASWIVTRPNVNGDGKNYYFTVTASTCPESPIVTASYSPDTVTASTNNPPEPNSETLLTLTFSNPNNAPLNGVGLVLKLDPSLSLVQTGTPVCTAGALSGTLAAHESCTIIFLLAATVAGTYNDGLGITSAAGTILATPTLKVKPGLEAPIAKLTSINPTTVNAGGPVAISLLFANPNSIALTNFKATVNLTGMTFSKHNGFSKGYITECEINTPAVGATSITVSVPTLAANSGCFLNITVVTTSSGPYQVATSTLTSNEAPPGTAISGILKVIPLKATVPCTFTLGSENTSVELHVNPFTDITVKVLTNSNPLQQSLTSAVAVEVRPSEGKDWGVIWKGTSVGETDTVHEKDSAIIVSIPPHLNFAFSVQVTTQCLVNP